MMSTNSHRYPADLALFLSHVMGLRTALSMCGRHFSVLFFPAPPVSGPEKVLIDVVEIRSESVQRDNTVPPSPGRSEY